MHSSHKVAMENQSKSEAMNAATDSNVALVREAGLPFEPKLGNVDPFVEWLSLMEVVEMLCPAEPAHNKPTLGNHWKL